MKTAKPSIAAMVLILGLSGAAQAQGVGNGGYAAYPGVGTHQDYYSINGGFGNYGLPGAYPGYRGHGLSGYGPGSNLDGYFAGRPNPNAGRVYNNTGGLINSIKQQTGKPGNYRNKPNPVVPGKRPAR